MHLTIDNASQFRDEFRAHNRGDQFSYEGLGLLFEYLEEADPQYDLDVIAICCEYSEETPEDIARNYSVDLEDCMDEEEQFCAIRDYLDENTSVVGVTSSGSIIYQQF